MFPGVDVREIVNCLKPEDVKLTGSVWLDRNVDVKQHICRLGHTSEWLRALNAASPKKSGTVRILWSIGDNLIFRLIFPLRALISNLREGQAKVKLEHVHLVAEYGHSWGMLKLAGPQKFIDFGETLEVLPSALYPAATAALVETG